MNTIKLNSISLNGNNLNKIGKSNAEGVEVVNTCISQGFWQNELAWSNSEAWDNEYK